MAKTSVLSRPLPNASQPRNTFDRSFFKNLNWSAGMLLPVFCQFVPVGSKGVINRSIFMRTNAVNTAAFPQMDTHIDFYKVPLKLLMTRYGEFKTNTSDCNSSSLTMLLGGLSAPPSTLPWFNLGTLYSQYFGTSNTSTDECGFLVREQSKRLMDLLGYNASALYLGTTASSALANMNMQSFRLQAYQKVYYDHYRNTAYESNDPMAYNADALYTEGYNNGEYGLNQFAKLLRLHYVNYRKDFFMNMYPALNYVVTNPNGLQWVIPSSVSYQVSNNSGNYQTSVVGSNSTIGGHVIVDRPASPGSGDHQVFTVQAIRASFALDKLMRLSAYAPKHVRDQMEARFGVKVSSASSYESQYLGSFKNDIVIGEVTATAAGTNGSESSELGQIGGRGVGAEPNGKDIHFEVTGDDNDSIIIGVMYTLARSVYDSFRVDAFNFKFSREDIFNPEFMDLGLRPITLKEVYTPTSASTTLAQLNTILGYVPRDQEYKLGIDENHGIFINGATLSPFTNHTNVNISQRGHTLGTPGVNASFFKISPSDLNSIFAQNFVESAQSTDQFFGKISFKFIVRQNMSVHGQPRL